ncbi:hypothetical protein NQZ68_012133 [Dissostichus eleginoides]|nr:hypothetical protein NQZ68_012133 [Dissostichus eleginoides]
MVLSSDLLAVTMRPGVSTECLEMWDYRHSGGRIKKGSDEPEREGAPFPPPAGPPSSISSAHPGFLLMARIRNTTSTTQSGESAC